MGGSSQFTGAGLDSLSLVGANAVPLVSVLFLGWSVYEVLVVYWAESGIVLFVSVLYLLFFTVDAETTAAEGERLLVETWADVRADISTVIFLLLSFGLFWAAHGFFIAKFPDAGNFPIETPFGTALRTVWFAVVTMVLSHAGRLVTNAFRTGPEQKSRVLQRLSDPANRTLVLHAVLVVGGVLVLALGSSAVLLAALVVAKTGIDLWLEVGRE